MTCWQRVAGGVVVGFWVRMFFGRFRPSRAVAGYWFVLSPCRGDVACIESYVVSFRGLLTAGDGYAVVGCLVVGRLVAGVWAGGHQWFISFWIGRDCESVYDKTQ